MAKKKKNGNGNGKKYAHAGQPTRYKLELNELVFKLCLLNATDVQIADVLGISESTLYNWKNKHPKFLEAIKRGKEKADADVAKSLFNRACGYSCPETKVFCHDGEIITHEVTKHYPPDTAAAFIWLKNRAGWKDKSDIVLKDDRLTDEERENLRNILKERQSGANGN